MTFLGIVGYSSAWVEDYAKLSRPLRAMIKETGSGQLHCNLTWTQDGHLAFETIKQKLQEAPALTLPDYSKNVVLYCMCPLLLEVNLHVRFFVSQQEWG